MTEHKQGDTYRTMCKRGRVTYHPEWSPSMPWATYINGTAGLHCTTLESACAYFSKHKMTLNTEVKT